MRRKEEKPNGRRMTARGVRWLVLLLVSVWGFMPVYAVHATTLEELKQQLEVLQQKVAEMEAQKAAEAQQAAELEAQKAAAAKEAQAQMAVSYTHLTLPTTCNLCRSRWARCHY